MSTYQDIGGGYKFAALRVGCSMIDPNGREVYFQPGDDTSLIIDTVEALDDISDDVNDAKRGAIADMAFGEYFFGPYFD